MDENNIDLEKLDSEEIFKEIEKTEVEMLKEEIEILNQEAQNTTDRLQRSLAEFDNYRKRTSKEKNEMHDSGVICTVEKILPIIDNFERAISAFENKEDNIYKGFKMILKQMYSFLEEVGVEKINTKGEKFDSKYHFAVIHIEDKNYSENEIIEELQKGYQYKNNVIRYTMVKVAN